MPAPASRHAVRGPLRLEDRSVPAVFTATVDPLVNDAAAVAEVIGFINRANANGDLQDTINLFPGGQYSFTEAFDRTDGGTALPVFVSTDGSAGLTINGNGGTFLRTADAPSFRFLRAAGNFLSGKLLTLTLNDLTLDGGNAFDTSLPSRNGSVFGAIQNGGAVRTDETLLVANNVRFVNNQSAGNGGAVSLGNTRASPLGHRLTNVTFENNKAVGKGGAIHVDLAGIVTVTGGTFTDNDSAAGAGVVDAFTTAVTFENSRLVGNTGQTHGTGNILGNTTLRNTLVRANVARQGGTGGIESSDILAVNSTIADNKALGALTGGGGLHGGNITLVNSTVHNNLASIGGGLEGDAITLIFSTVTNNTATFGIASGGGIDARVVTLQSSVVAGNAYVGGDSTDPVDDIKATQVTTKGFNLIGVSPANFTPDAGDFVGGTRAAPIDPLLGPLRDNGGGVLTRKPYRGSPVIDAGGASSVTDYPTDARGEPRSGLPDIGSFEVQPTDDLVNPPGPLPTITAVGPGANRRLLADPTRRFGGAIAGTVNSTGTTAAPVLPAETKLYNAAGQVTFTASPFGAVPGGIRTAAADVTGDGVADLIAGTGPGVPARVAVYNGATGKLVLTFAPFEDGFLGGVFVSTGDLTGDGTADLIISPDEGGGPRVRVLRGEDFAQIADFFGIDDLNFRGGVRTAAGDITGDGTADLIVSAGFGGGPRVAVFDGTSLTGGAFTKKPFGDFLAFEDTFRNGVFVAAGDVDGDGVADIVAGAGPGGGPRVKVFSGASLNEGVQLVFADFLAGDVNNRGGARVAVKNLDGDKKADVVVAPGLDGPSQFYGYAGKILSLPPITVTGTNGAVSVQPRKSLILTTDVFPGYDGGLFVG